MLIISIFRDNIGLLVDGVDGSIGKAGLAG